MSKAQDIHRLLIQEYGDRPWQPRADPLSELIGTVLSQNTSDVNSGRAYASLRAELPTWEAVRDAPVEQVEAAIHCGGLAAIKARRIQAMLREIAGRLGCLDLGFLENLSDADARGWLESLDGVGPKTAACVLMFSLGRPVMPVDTHVHRLSRRLGLAGPGDSPVCTQAALEAVVPPDDRYAFHINLIAHGRAVCKAQRPLCGDCLLACRCSFVGVPSELARQSGFNVLAND